MTTTTATLLDKRSDPLMVNAAYAGLTIVDCLALGISPIALLCDEKYVPLFDRACQRFGYVYEWVPEWPDAELLSGQVRTGEAVLTKVDPTPKYEIPAVTRKVIRGFLPK